VTKWQLACIDMAGTTVRDEGLVDQAFRVAVAGQGVVPGTAEYEHMRAVVRKTQGQSKIEVFRLLLGGDERRARAANETFEEAYGLLVDEGAVRAIPGAVEAVQTLRAAGVKVALTTGFARSTQDAIIDAIGWRGVVDLALSPADAGRGRPFPDLVLVAALRLGVDDMRHVVVVGDTPLDMIAGCRAGAGLVVGVLTGAGDRPALLAAGATCVIGSIGELPGLLDVGGRLPSLRPV
jgi:phosphoglycolate phosphatase